MEDLGMWATPLVLLPGVALLVLSTSIRFGQLHEEIHQLGEQPSERLPNRLRICCCERACFATHS